MSIWAPLEEPLINRRLPTRMWPNPIPYRQFILSIWQKITGRKITRDIGWTTGSLTALACSGIIINIVIVTFQDVATLGTFNITYAVYIIASQFAAWGIQFSVLRHTTYYKGEPAERNRMLSTACVMGLVMGVLCMGVVIALQDAFAELFSSAMGAAFISSAALGLALFPLNKMLLAYVNGLRHMKLLATIQTTRYVTIMIAVICFAILPGKAENIALSFPIAELMGTVVSLSTIIRYRLAKPARVSLGWVKRHFIFGSKGLVSGVLIDANTRVDVLLIGVLMGEREAGIYSFAALLVDGLSHILGVLRVNFNPVLVSSIKKLDWTRVHTLRVHSKRFVLPMFMFLSLLLLLTFYILAGLLIPGKGLAEGLPSLLILLAGTTAVCVLAPFDNMLMVSGHPGYQTIQQILMMLVNIATGIVLLPRIGIEGAALGTAASYLTNVAVFSYYSNRLFGWNPITNNMSTTDKMRPRP